MSCDQQARAGIESDPGAPRPERLGLYFRMAQ
jgi:hypothetical protein